MDADLEGHFQDLDDVLGRDQGSRPTIKIELSLTSGYQL